MNDFEDLYLVENEELSRKERIIRFLKDTVDTIKCLVLYIIPFNVFFTLSIIIISLKCRFNHKVLKFENVEDYIVYVIENSKIMPKYIKKEILS